MSTTPGTETGTVSLDGFRSLNPADGLFLRAEHLDAIQSYARSLVAATATATGTGVVHGLRVTLADGTATDSRSALEISPGVAISPTGRLLRLGRTLRVHLDAGSVPARLNNGFWVVELHWASGTSGSAPVYGSLCHDACSDGGSTIAPWRDEGVEVLLTPDSLAGLDATSTDVRRSWLASAYFERERAAGQPWLLPAKEGGRVAPLPTRAWDDGTALPPEAGVPLAALQQVDGDWVLDQWTARRLVDGPAAHDTWRSRLAMRPWTVFLAQVLQLEDQLADAGAALGLADAYPGRLVVLDVEVEEELREPIERYMREMRDKFPSKWHQFTELEEAVHGAAVRKRGKLTAVRSLEGLGLRELPPAGYLSVDETQAGLAELLTEFFGPRVELRLRTVRADQVAGAVMDAQHRDRIPLDSDLGRPQVDVLVPLEPADKVELAVPGYGWVAFVRASEAPVSAPPPPETEEVTVYVGTGDGDDPVQPFRDGELRDAREIGVLRYPVGGWEFPGGEVAQKAAALVSELGVAAVVALTDTTARAPLAALRAALFVASVDSGIAPPPVHAFPDAGGGEAIVLVLQAQR